MQIFISWSGPPSKRAGKALRAYLKAANPASRPWVSDIDIPAGADWFQEIMEQLHKSSAAVLCITPDNLRSQWMHFEAGAIAAAAAIERKPVCPYLIGGVAMNQLTPPLNTRHAVQADEAGTRRLAESLNARLDPAKRLSGDVLRKNCAISWPNLKSELDKINIHYPLEISVGARAQEEATFKRKVFFFIKNASDLPVVLTNVTFAPHRKGPQLDEGYSKLLKAGQMPKFLDKAKALHELPSAIVDPGETTHVYVAYRNSLPIADIEKAVKNKEIGMLTLDLWLKGRTIRFGY
jgi:hypothetical protein